MKLSVPRTLVAVCLLLLAFVRAAHADDPAEKAAKRYYDKGQKLYNLQKFEEALEQYQRAFDAKPLPGFLFNIAQCQRNLGEYEAAIFSYKRFLQLDPETEKREKVEALIEELEQKTAEDDTERLRLGKRKKADREDDEAADAQPIEAGEGAPVYKKWWFWTGVAVVGVAGGVGLYYATKSGGAPGTDFGNVDFPK